MAGTNNNKNRSLYRNSFAATLLFSGVQIYSIIIRVVKSKFVAVLIGPGGMGIMSLLQTTTETIAAATNFGLKTSSVKNIAAANRDGNQEVIAKTITALRRLILCTGLLGMLICAILAPVWSNTSFGNNTYVWSFVFVSVIILFDQLNNGELALLQGTQQKKKLARANIIGQTLNAVLTIPLYYIWGLQAIVATLVLGSLITFLISKYYTRKLNISHVEMTWKETLSMGLEMVKLGFFLSLQYLMSTIVVWIVRNYVSSIGGVEDVGLYSAGTSIVTTYVGLVFAAISTDYYPRLAATKNNQEMGEAVRAQAELLILMLTPLVMAFIVFCKPVIMILYSSKFLPIENMMYWSIGATMLQAMGWAIAWTLLAKAKPIYYFTNELIAMLWGLPIRLYCYYTWGLTGFGMATFICYGFYMIQVQIIAKKLFGLSYQLSLWRLFILLVIPIVLVVFLKLVLNDIAGQTVGSVVLVLVSLYVLYKLNQKMDLKSLVWEKLNKK